MWCCDINQKDGDTVEELLGIKKEGAFLLSLSPSAPSFLQPWLSTALRSNMEPLRCEDPCSVPLFWWQLLWGVVSTSMSVRWQPSNEHQWSRRANSSGSTHRLLLQQVRVCGEDSGRESKAWTSTCELLSLNDDTAELWEEHFDPQIWPTWV